MTPVGELKRTLLLLWLNLLVCSWVVAVQDPGEEPSLQKDCEVLARKATTFDTERLLYGHSPFKSGFRWIEGQKENQEHFLALAKKAARSDVEPLLKHADPRVKLLALGILYHNGEVHSLPKMAALAEDPTETIPMPGSMPQRRMSAQEEESLPMRKQTVGSAAAMMVGHYLNAAGYYQGMTTFHDYWEKHGSRTYSLSWFAVDLKKAMRGSSPPSDSPDFSILRKKINLLSEEEKLWVLLGLGEIYEDFDENFGPAYANKFVSKEERLQMLRKAGPEKVLLFLQGETVSEDPDFQPGGYALYQNAAKKFILKNAAGLFKPEASDALLHQGQAEFGRSGGKEAFRNAAWWIAAAEIDRGRSDKILGQGFDFFVRNGLGDDEVVPLLNAFWRLSPQEALAVSREWFFLQEKKGYSYSHAREEFIRGMSKAGKDSSRRLFEALLMDPAADAIPKEVLAEFAAIINTWVPEPLATQDELDQMRGSWGKGVKKEKENNDPKMSAEMLARLRKSLSLWRMDP